MIAPDRDKSHRPREQARWERQFLESVLKASLGHVNVMPRQCDGVTDIVSSLFTGVMNKLKSEDSGETIVVYLPLVANILDGIMCTFQIAHDRANAVPVNMDDSSH